jgi:C-methyltransferase C-terminal domain/Putative zinc binding domain/Methyltransferase domain
MPIYSAIDRCRLCQSHHLIEVMPFGEQFLASTFVPADGDHALSSTKVPLTAVLCGDCGLLQLKETVDRNVLFSEYFYRSSTNPMMAAALRDIADDLKRRIDLKRGDSIVDVGCNDGTLLSFLPCIYNRVGVEPAENINWDGLDKSISIINSYFTSTKVLQATCGQRCKAVTSIAMLYSVLDANDFAAEIKSILAPDGVWCVQVSYLPLTLQSLSFYDICHEHLYYFSLTTLNRLMEQNGLTIFDATTNDVNGGSLRAYITHQELGRRKSDNVDRLIKKEKELRLGEATTYQGFFSEIQTLRGKVRNYIATENQKGNLTVGLGASTKGNVLLQYFEIDRRMLPYISERNPEKVSLRTLGTGIELISEERARALNPACMLVLIWFFKDEILKREQEYLQQGGKLLFPMPYCHIVSKHGETRL